MPGKEREKTGTGKKLERTFFSPFLFLYFLTTFFSHFWRKSSKTGEKRGGRLKKRLERCGTTKNGRSTPFQIVESGEIPFFMPFKTRFCPVPTPFLPLSKPLLDPFLNPLLPLSKLVLVHFLYCLAIIFRCTPVAAQPLDHVGSSPVCGPMGGLYSWRGDARDQFVCMSAPMHGSKWSDAARKARA